MASIRKASRIIDAPVELVFKAVTDTNEFHKAAPHIKSVKVLDGTSPGIGYKFCETRVMNGSESTTVLEITEYKENDYARFVTDQGGAVWDTLYTVKPDGNGSELSLEMECRPHKFMAKLMTPLIMGTVGKAMEADMDAVAAFCEGREFAAG